MPPEGATEPKDFLEEVQRLYIAQRLLITSEVTPSAIFPDQPQCLWCRKHSRQGRGPTVEDPHSGCKE